MAKMRTALLSSGPLADDAWVALDRLSRDLLAVRAEDVLDSTLGSGHAGIALAHAYLAPLFPARAHVARLGEMADAASAGLASREYPASLFDGFLGPTWVLRHLDDNDAAHAAIDDALERFLAPSPWNAPFDLMVGLAGVSVYLLERLPSARAASLLERIVACLAESAAERDGGIAWATYAERWLPPELHGDRPPVYFDPAVAHGQAGVMAVLAALVAHGLGGETAPRLLAGATAWMRAQRMPEDALSRFPRIVRTDRAPETARDAWCYGDPGIAAALLAAARATSDDALEAMALDAARWAATRDAATSKCVDPALCHGALGKAHIFHRLYRATGDELFADVARASIARGLTMHDPRGFGGFATLNGAAFLHGGAGVALALAAAVSAPEDDPGWDRTLLLSLSVPPRTKLGAT
jgi:hypothetical protein